MNSDMYLLPLQLDAIKAIQQQSKEWFQELNAIYTKQRTFIWAICDTLGLPYDHKSAGLFVWAKPPDSQDDKI